MEKDLLKEDLQLRLKKVEGQIRGINKMLAEERSCSDIVVQLSAVRSALDNITSKLVISYAMDCFEKLPCEEAKESLLKALMLISKNRCG